jgi:hypothetical protein
MIERHVCSNVAKYPDGTYNNSMLLTMDDSSRVAAIFPNLNTGPANFITASDVSAMGFVN